MSFVLEVLTLEATGGVGPVEGDSSEATLVIQSNGSGVRVGSGGEVKLSFRDFGHGMFPFSSAPDGAVCPGWGGEACCFVCMPLFYQLSRGMARTKMGNMNKIAKSVVTPCEARGYVPGYFGTPPQGPQEQGMSILTPSIGTDFDPQRPSGTP